MKIKLVSCPNCGGDDEPWFFPAPGSGRQQYMQTCAKCQYEMIYTKKDVTKHRYWLETWEPIVVD